MISNYVYGANIRPFCIHSYAATIDAPDALRNLFMRMLMSQKAGPSHTVMVEMAFRSMWWRTRKKVIFVILLLTVN